MFNRRIEETSCDASFYIPEKAFVSKTLKAPQEVPPSTMEIRKQAHTLFTKYNQ